MAKTDVCVNWLIPSDSWLSLSNSTSQRRIVVLVSCVTVIQCQLTDVGKESGDDAAYHKSLVLSTCTNYFSLRLKQITGEELHWKTCVINDFLIEQSQGYFIRVARRGQQYDT